MPSLPNPILWGGGGHPNPHALTTHSLPYTLGGGHPMHSLLHYLTLYFGGGGGGTLPYTLGGGHPIPSLLHYLTLYFGGGTLPYTLGGGHPMPSLPNPILWGGAPQSPCTHYSLPTLALYFGGGAPRALTTLSLPYTLGGGGHPMHSLLTPYPLLWGGGTPCTHYSLPVSLHYLTLYFGGRAPHALTTHSLTLPYTLGGGGGTPCTHYSLPNLVIFPLVSTCQLIYQLVLISDIFKFYSS